MAWRNGSEASAWHGNQRQNGGVINKSEKASWGSGNQSYPTSLRYVAFRAAQAYLYWLTRTFRDAGFTTHWITTAWCVVARVIMLFASAVCWFSTLDVSHISLRLLHRGGVEHPWWLFHRTHYTALHYEKVEEQGRALQVRCSHGGRLPLGCVRLHLRAAAYATQRICVLRLPTLTAPLPSLVPYLFYRGVYLTFRCI